MRPTTFLLALAAQRAVAHTVNSIFIVNGTYSKEFQYVRNVGLTCQVTLKPDGTCDWERLLKHVEERGNSDIVDQPHIGKDALSVNMTCGREAWLYAANTSTATVIAGSEVGFRTLTYYHTTGPVTAYLARLPDNEEFATYHGAEADWFKIAYFGPKNKTTWTVTEHFEPRFKIPKNILPGRYLLRVEHLFNFVDTSRNQIYPNCAHIEILGSGTAFPTDFVKFPGLYKMDTPGFGLTHEESTQQDLSKYRHPGPGVWTG